VCLHALVDIRFRLFLKVFMLTVAISMILCFAELLGDHDAGVSRSVTRETAADFVFHQHPIAAHHPPAVLPFPARFTPDTP
jgi:hypothetical protein